MKRTTTINFFSAILFYLTHKVYFIFFCNVVLFAELVHASMLVLSLFFCSLFFIAINFFSNKAPNIFLVLNTIKAFLIIYVVVFLFFEFFTTNKLLLLHLFIVYFFYLFLDLKFVTSILKKDVKKTT
tara:strand:+ start:707 stop:1087 length:381 start_codon:yes stop_codon:yes gene_type:complete